MNLNPSTLAMLDLVAKVTAVLLIGFAAASFLRRSSAAARSLLWLAVFAVLVMLPASLIVQPLWAWTVSLGEKAQPRPRHEPAVVSMPLVESETPKIADSAAPAAAVSSLQRENLLPQLSAGEWLLAGYLAVAGLLLIRRMLGSWLLMRLPLADADQRAVKMAGQLCSEHSIWRRVAVRHSPRAAAPMTWGIARPVLLLPAESATWNDDDLRAAIRHEFAHIRHWDAAKRWLAAIVTAFAWPHPLVWLAARAWRLEQERACDDFVITSGSPPESYAAQLLAAAKTIRCRSFVHTSALVMAMPSGLEVRIRSVAAENIDRSRCSRGFKLALLAAVVITGAGGTLIQARAEDAKSKVSEPSREIQIFIQSQIFSAPAGAVPMNNPVGIPWTKPQPGFDGVLTAEQFELYKKKIESIKGVMLWARPGIYTLPGREGVISAGMRKEQNRSNQAAEDIVVKLALNPTIDPKLKWIDLNLDLQINGSKKPLSEPPSKVSVTVFPGHTIMLRGANPMRPEQEIILFLTPSLVFPKTNHHIQPQAPKSKRTDAETDNRLIHIQSRLAEITNETAIEHPALKKAMGGERVILSDAEMQALWRSISQKKGAHLLSAPSITTKPQTGASAEVIREFVYPTEFVEKDGHLSPIAFEIMPIGVSVAFDPDLDADGRVRIESAKATVNDFHGYVRGGKDMLEYDGRTTWRMPANGKPKGREMMMPEAGPLERFHDPEMSNKWTDLMKQGALKKGEVTLPIFSTHEWSGEAKLRPGEWLVSFLKLTGKNARQEHARQIWCFISAMESSREADKHNTKPALPAGKRPAIHLQALFERHDPVTGITTAVGEAKTTIGGKTIKAGELRYYYLSEILEATNVFEIRDGRAMTYSINPSSRAVFFLKSGELKIYGPSSVKFTEEAK